jgi:hypothetical protein
MKLTAGHTSKAPALKTAFKSVVLEQGILTGQEIAGYE